MAGSEGRTLAAWSVPSAPRAEAFTFSGPDRATLAALLSQVAAAAPGLSDAELSDLACQSGRELPLARSGSRWSPPIRTS